MGVTGGAPVMVPGKSCFVLGCCLILSLREAWILGLRGPLGRVGLESALDAHEIVGGVRAERASAFLVLALCSRRTFGEAVIGRLLPFGFRMPPFWYRLESTSIVSAEPDRPPAPGAALACVFDEAEPGPV